MSTLREAQPPAAPTAATTSTTRDRLVAFTELLTSTSISHRRANGDPCRLDRERRGRSSAQIPAPGGDNARQLAKNPWEYSDGRVGQPIAPFPHGSTRE